MPAEAKNYTRESVRPYADSIALAVKEVRPRNKIRMVDYSNKEVSITQIVNEYRRGIRCQYNPYIERGPALPTYVSDKKKWSLYNSICRDEAYFWSEVAQGHRASPRSTNGREIYPKVTL